MTPRIEVAACVGLLDAMLEPFEIDLVKEILKLETEFSGSSPEGFLQDAKKLPPPHRNASIPSSVIPK